MTTHQAVWLDLSLELEWKMASDALSSGYLDSHVKRYRISTSDPRCGGISPEGRSIELYGFIYS